jgi:hypothetical protein
MGVGGVLGGKGREWEGEGTGYGELERDGKEQGMRGWREKGNRDTG